VSYLVFPCLPFLHTTSHVFPCLPMSSHVFPCLPLSYRVFPSLQKRVPCGCLLLVLCLCVFPPESVSFPSSARCVLLFPPESIAFPSRNVCHTCLLLVLCLSLFPPESIAFPSSARCVLLCCCCVLLHVLRCVCYCMCSCRVLPLCAAPVCYCMIDHACLLLVLSCLVLLRCSLLCVSYHSTHRTYNGSTRTHAHPRSYGVYSSKWWQVLQSSHPWHVLLPPLDHSSQLLLVISSTACPCWPWCRHDFCAFSAAGSQSTCAASTGCGQVSRMARSLCPTQPNGPRPYRIVSLCHSEGAQSTS